MINETNTPTRTLELYEVMDIVKSKRSKKAKIEALREHSDASTRDYLQCLFDERVSFLLPEGKPPYNPSPEESVPSSWHKRNVELKYFVRGLEGERLIPFRRENIFINILETIHPKDAELILKMVNKEVPFKSLTVELVKEAFPDLLP